MSSGDREVEHRDKKNGHGFNATLVYANCSKETSAQAVLLHLQTLVWALRISQTLIHD